MERRHPPDAVDATGKLIADCYCPRRDHYSGGDICRVCRRVIAVYEANAAAPDGPPTQAGGKHDQSLLL